MNLRNQIFLAAFALGIIPLLTLVGVNLRGHIKRHEEVGLQQAEARQALELANLDSTISHYRQDLRAIASLPEIPRILATNQRPALSPEFVGLINTWLADQEAITEICVADKLKQKKISLIRNDKFFIPATDDFNANPEALETDRDQLLISTTSEVNNDRITASFSLATKVFLAKYPDSLWINPAGAYLHQPATVNLTMAPGTNALADFPELQDILNRQKASLWESPSGYAVSWLPVILDGLRPALWIGTEIDRTASLKWKNSLIRNIITITMGMAALIFIIANGVAGKIDSIKEQILTGLDQVMNQKKEFTFRWTGPKEIRTMAEDLSKLARQYVKTSQAKEKAEAALSENQENFRNLTNSAKDAIVLMDHQGNISYWNQTATEMFGYQSSEVIGKPIHPLISPRLMENRAGEPKTSYTSGEDPIRETIELIAKRRDGSDLPVELSLSEARIKNKWHSIWIIRDISERKQAEEDSFNHQRQLIQADKMASLGLLVSGMAHEINNPNGIALLNTPMLAKAWQSVSPILEQYYAAHGDFLVAGLEYSEMKEEIPKLFTELEESSRRIRAIVKDLKDYARQDNTESMELVEINEIAGAATRLTDNLIKKSTNHFSEKYGEDLPPVQGNRQRLEQVVINLLQNSCDALPNSEAAITIETGLADTGEEVFLRIIDEGCGIPADSINRVTDPFFTTKRDSGGTGLGLSVSAGIIKEHRGRMSFASSGPGTIVTIMLPRAEDQRKTEVS